MKPLHTLLLILSLLVVGGSLFASGLLTGLRLDETDSEEAEEPRLSEETNGSKREPTEPPLGNQPPREWTATDNPLSNHNTYITFSDSSTSFPEGTLVAEGASVPDLLVCHTDSDACQKGEFLIYFVDAKTLTAPNVERISVVRSTDGGKTWSERQTIDIEGKPDATLPAVDPSVVQLSDGSLRLYVAFFDMRPDRDPSAEHEVLSAVSSDGMTFTVEDGVRLSKSKLTDPEVIYANETWYMFYSLGQGSGLALSDDGLDFEDQGELDVAVGGVPGALAEADGAIRVYGCTQKGIVSASSDDGADFTLHATPVLPILGTCDPSVQSYEDGFVFVYKLMVPAPETFSPTPR